MSLRWGIHSLGAFESPPECMYTAGGADLALSEARRRLGMFELPLVPL